MSVRIYHNSRCSKSRETLALIRKTGIEPEIIEYLKSPPSEEELTHLLSLLDMKPAQLIRQKEAEYKALGLTGKDDATLIRAMHEHPKLIERPIVVTSQRAVLGRPPEQVLEILS